MNNMNKLNSINKINKPNTIIIKTSKTPEKSAATEKPLEYRRRPNSGITQLEKLLSHGDCAYILRQLYRLVLMALTHHNNPKLLRRRLKRFEASNDLPPCFSTAPLNSFLEELDDAQYRYSLFEVEVFLPTLNDFRNPPSDLRYYHDILQLI